jgi:signal transduction histidine kinase
MTRRARLLYNLFQDLSLGIVALVCALDLYQAGGPWWLALVFSAALLALYHYWPENHPLFLGLQLLLIAALQAFNMVGMILGFTFAVHAVIIYPNRKAIPWIGALSLVTVGLYALHTNWVEAMLVGIGISLGYAAFAYFTYARVSAETERRKSEALLAELRVAHDQLKAYTDRAEELAVAQERNRLAREMHDTLGHRLTVAAVQLEGAQRLIPNDPDKAARMVGTVRQQVSEALTELRRTVATLRTPLEADLPLSVALTRLARDFEESTSLSVHLELPEKLPDELPDSHRLALYRAAQEGLTNVQRHAHASQAWLRLTCEEGVIALTIADNGNGFPASDDLPGFGLRGLRERAAQLDGELHLEGRPGGGAQLTLRLPVPDENP